MIHSSGSKERAFRRPLHQALRDPVEDAAVARMWHEIEARHARAPMDRRRLWAPLAAAAAVLLLVLGAFWMRGPEQPGALLTAEGTPFVRLVSTPDGGRQQRFADGSLIEAASDTRVEGLAFTADEVSLLLERGSLKLSVVPGGPRRWVVEAKLARVEVTGTRFTVARREGRVGVVVIEGSVVVHSPLLSEGVKRLTSGEALELEQPAKVEAAPAGTSSSTAVEAVAASPPMRPSPSAVGSAFSSLNAEELMRRADAARLAGDLASAELLLERVVREWPQDSRAAVAAFTLGVVRMSRGDLARATEALRLSLALGAPATLQQDCYLRLVEAELRSSQPERATATSEEYLRKFPSGRHRRAIARLLEERGEASP